MRQAVLTWLAATLLAGCVDRVGHETRALTLSDPALDQRRIQARIFDTADDAALLRAAANVLSRLGFTLDDTPASLGIVSARQDRLPFERRPPPATAIMPVLFRATGMFDTTLKVQVTVSATRTADRGRVMLRTSIQRLVWTSLSQSSHLVAVNDPDIYRDFYRDLTQSSSIQAHEP